MSNTIALRIYRALLRQAKQLDGQQLTRPLPADAQWGTHRFVSAFHSANKAQLLQDLFPGLAPTIEALSIAHLPESSSQAQAAGTTASTPPEPSTSTQHAAPAASSELSVQRLVSAAFHAQQQAPAGQQQALIDEAFRALRLALEQQYLARCSSSRTTQGVRVDVSSRFEQMAQGFRGESIYVFTYRVRVSNLRQEPIKILGRSWTIRNDSGQKRVHIPLDPGNAVVGQQPLLQPGHGFEYFSGTDLDTPAGLQSGALMVDVFGDGKGRPATDRITVDIAPFPLLHPSALK